MKAKQEHQNLKPHAPSRLLFSCGLFRRCTRSVLSPSSSHKPSYSSSSSLSSSSASTSQSFTQWYFPHHPDPESRPVFDPPVNPTPSPPPPSSIPPLTATTLQETFHIAELHLISGSDSDQLFALRLLEGAIVPDPPSDPTCPSGLMRGLVRCLRTTDRSVAKYTAKILLALCLDEGNRRVAVEAGAAGALVETVAGLEAFAAEQALAVLELVCTVLEGAEEVRAHAMTVPVMVAVMARLTRRGREYAMSVLAVVYGGEGGWFHGEDSPAAHAEGVARAVALALQGECTTRGMRKGAQLLKTLEEYAQSDLSRNGA